MKHGKDHDYTASKRVKLLVYIIVLLLNTGFFVCIGWTYNQSSAEYSQGLFNENINTVENVNVASANAADTYMRSMGIKVDDCVSYIRKNRMSYEQTVRYISESSTNADRQFQLVLSGSYARTGEVSFGDYSGVSIRKIENENGGLDTIITDIIYGSGYYDILKSFTDIDDENLGGLCFAPEFTDPDTKQKCFGVYRHVVLTDGNAEKKLYTLMLAINSRTALDAYNLQSEYKAQSTVLINEFGDYIIKSTEYRNASFYDYIANYNGLSTDEKKQLQNRILETTQDGKPTVNLFYKNHRGEDCVFAVAAMENGWHSVTCVPLSSFKLESNAVNYSLIIMLMFLVLFLMDTIFICYFGRIMNYNIRVAKTAQAEANRANAAKSRFLSTMSHELRTPLNAIIGLTSLSRDSIEQPAVLRDYLKKIDISSKLLLQLISDILDISAIESGKIRLNNVRFDIGRLITSLSAIYYDQCAVKGIEFSVVLKNMHTETVLGDSVRLNQILLNFLSNAVKFTPGGGQITLVVEQVRQNDETTTISFEVRDTGCGISADMRARLFKPFERESGAHAVKYSGTGLGLSIAKSLTELMNGEISVDSTEGVGSSFRVEIPFVVPDRSAKSSFSPLKNLRMLAAIRNPDERRYIGEILHGFGLECVLVDAAEAAAALITEGMEKEKPFDMCMLDWKLSDLNAMDASARIRALSDKIKIIVLTYDLGDARPQCMKAGADYVFCKPVFSSLLYNFLQEINTGNDRQIIDTPSSFDMRGKRVLLVEDNALNREIAVLLLDKIHLEVEQATDGTMGYESFLASEEGHFDAILMDIQMPGMNGYEAARAIRACRHPQAKTIPILAMTADAFSEDVEKASEAGMNDHLAKPINPDNLYQTLEKYICHSQANAKKGV